MAILLECGSCGRKFRAKDQYRGKRVKCPDCRTHIVIEGERVADHDVFISYSKHDKAVADAICAALESKRMRCWIAPRDIEVGQKWGAAIVSGIEDARAMVVVYSAHSNRSEQVIREVERAVAKSVPILPFRIDQTPMCKEMEYFLSASHWLDALTGPLEEHIRRLVSTARGLFAGLDQSAEPHAAVAPAQCPAPPGQVTLPGTAKILSRLKLAGIFNIVVGILSLLWAILMLLAVFGEPTLAEEDPEVPLAVVNLMILVMLALSVACGIVELLAGIKLLKRRPGARKLGIISGVASCASLWGCCVYPFCLAAGIFTLILLFKEQYRLFLERGEAVG